MQKRYKKTQKLNWLAEWQSSGLPAKKFAEGKPFSASSLNYWNRNIKSTSESSSFIQVIPDLIKMTPYAKLTYPSGIILEFFTPVPCDYFKGLLK